MKTHSHTPQAGQAQGGAMHDRPCPCPAHGRRFSRPIGFSGAPADPFRRSLAKGFTLLEILAATVVATILLTVSLQVLGSSSTAVKDADKKRNAQTQLRTALDRFAADFSSAMLTGGCTAIWNSDPNGAGTEISFLSRSRPESKGSASTSPRGAAIGYALLDHRQTSGSPTYSELMRGDGLVAFTSDLGDIFKDIGDSNGGTWNAWEPLGAGIVRFHISFLLDDGTITQTPPAYSMTSPQGTGEVSFMNNLQLLPSRIAIAFTERNKQRAGIGGGNAANNDRYVKALIVAAAAVDRDVLVQTLKANKLSEINDLDEPGAGETPLEVWEKNLTRISHKPLLQNIRFQQRTIPVS